MYFSFNFQPKAVVKAKKFERRNGGDINIFIDIVAFTIEFTRKEKEQRIVCVSLSSLCSRFAGPGPIPESPVHSQSQNQVLDKTRPLNKQITGTCTNWQIRRNRDWGHLGVRPRPGSIVPVPILCGPLDSLWLKNSSVQFDRCKVIRWTLKLSKMAPTNTQYMMTFGEPNLQAHLRCTLNYPDF